MRQKGQLGVFLKEQVGVQRMQVDQMEREMETAKKWGAMQRSANKTLKKQVSIIIISSITTRSDFTSFCRLGATSADRFISSNI